MLHSEFQTSKHDNSRNIVWQSCGVDQDLQYLLQWYFLYYKSMCADREILPVWTGYCQSQMLLYVLHRIQSSNLALTMSDGKGSYTGLTAVAEGQSEPIYISCTRDRFQKKCERGRMRARGVLTGDGKTAALKGESNSFLHRQHGGGVIK